MPKKILIVGGGYTGLTAALRLAQAGRHSVTLTESSSQLGGLAAGFQLGGTWLEKTYHHIFLTDDTILKLIAELGVEKHLIWCDSSVAIFRDGIIHAFTTPLDLLRFKPCSFSGRLRTGVTAFYLKHRKDWRGLLRQGAHDWMARACGPGAMDVIWTPLLKGKFGEQYDEVSMAWLWARLHTRANSRSPGGEKLGYFRGGFNVITAALEAELRRLGVIIQTGATVDEFYPDRRAAVIDGRDVSFDSCVFTGSSAALAGLLPKDGACDAYARKIGSIGYLGAICLIFTSDQDLGKFYWVNVNEQGAPFLVFIQQTNLVDPDSYGGRHVYYIGAYLPVDGRIYSLPDDELTKLWFDYLPKMFPQFDVARVSEKYIFRFRAAQHIVDRRYDEKVPGHQTPLPGVYLANFSQIFPEDRGTNFAVAEGENIASLVEQDLAAGR
ncbi:MAG: NAD(P)/FAD-dependent oxidoreductase [Verrucomicrobiota bacterium]|jgi:protoporphyrinogen oxidase